MIKDILDKTQKILNLLNADVQPMSIDIGEHRAEINFKNNDVSAVITDKDIILYKMKDNRYHSSKRIMFGLHTFLTISEIHQIEDFILYN